MNFKIGDFVILNSKGYETLLKTTQHKITYDELHSIFRVYNTKDIDGDYELISLFNHKHYFLNDSEIECANIDFGINKLLKETKLEELNEKYKELRNIEIKNNKEEKKEKGVSMKMNGMMKKIFGEIGTLETGAAALTFTGEIVFKREDGDYVRYNAETETIDNQMEFVIKGTEKMMFLMPVNVVNVGDVLKHKGQFVQIIKVNDNGSLKAINLETGTSVNLLKETNIMGMQFYSKVVSMFNMQNNNSMQGINPMVLMMMAEDTDSDMMQMMLISQMFGGQQTSGMMQNINPALMMCMMNKGESSDIMNIMLMSQMFGGQNGGFIQGTPINNNSPTLTDEQFQEFSKKIIEEQALAFTDNEE